MPARKSTIKISDPDAQNADISAPHQGVKSDQLDDDVERILDEIGENNGAAILWREKDNAPGDFDYLIRRSAKGLTLEFVREQFGGGRYKMILVDPVHGALNPVFFSVDARWIGKAFVNPSAPVPGVRNDDGFRDRMLEILMTAIVSQRAQPQQPTRDPLLETLITGLLAERRGGDGNGTDMLKTVLETATTLASAMNPPEGMPGVLAAALPAIEKLASAHQLSARRQAVARVLPPATAAATVSHPVATVNTPTAQTSQPATVAGTIFPKWLEPFRSMAPRLVSLADKDADPELYADLVIDALTDDDNEVALQGALEAMQQNNLLADALRAVPQMTETPERKAWLEKFVEAVRVGLADLMDQTAAETAPDTEVPA